mmetsp:Transcript_6192/g.9002  ORF Transcript_6192/g.9002 Transcript_6192/m.9002 type:complete len:452 (-) Transcript_6192:43-1398(-)
MNNIQEKDIIKFFSETFNLNKAIIKNLLVEYDNNIDKMLPVLLDIAESPLTDMKSDEEIKNIFVTTPTTRKKITKKDDNKKRAEYFSELFPFLTLETIEMIGIANSWNEEETLEELNHHTKMIKQQGKIKRGGNEKVKNSNNNKKKKQKIKWKNLNGMQPQTSFATIMNSQKIHETRTKKLKKKNKKKMYSTTNWSQQETIVSQERNKQLKELEAFCKDTCPIEVIRDIYQMKHEDYKETLEELMEIYPQLKQKQEKDVYAENHPKNKKATPKEPKTIYSKAALKKKREQEKERRERMQQYHSFVSDEDEMTANELNEAILEVGKERCEALELAVSAFRNQDHIHALKHQVKAQDLQKELTYLLKMKGVTGFEETLDLHGLIVEDAVATTRSYLQRAKNACANRCQIITGKGKHSKDRSPKLRPAIKRLLRGSRDVRFREIHPGIFNVYVF